MSQKAGARLECLLWEARGTRREELLCLPQKRRNDGAVFLAKQKPVGLVFDLILTQHIKISHEILYNSNITIKLAAIFEQQQLIFHEWWPNICKLNIILTHQSPNQHKSMYLYRTTHSEQVELAYNHMVVIRLFIALICSNNEYSCWGPASGWWPLFVGGFLMSDSNKVVWGWFVV